MRRIHLVVVLVLAVAAWNAPLADARSLPECHTWFSCVDEGEPHYMGGTIYGLWFSSHSNCLNCVGGPAYCHETCLEEDSFAGADAKEVLRSILDAASRQDVATVVALAPEAAGYVIVNEARGAVQLLSCDKRTVIASLRLNDPVAVASLAVRLAVQRHYDPFKAIDAIE